MAVSGWIDKNTLRVEMAGKHYYFHIALNQDGSKRVELKEWTKSQTRGIGFKKSSTREIMIFENHVRDVLKGLIKVCKRLDIPVKDILEKQGVECEPPKQAARSFSVV